MSHLGYICCFCGNPIVSSVMDVTGLTVISNLDKAVERQHEQQLFCHINCLQEKIANQVPLYIEE